MSASSHSVSPPNTPKSTSLEEESNEKRISFKRRRRSLTPPKEFSEEDLDPVNLQRRIQELRQRTAHFRQELQDLNLISSKGKETSKKDKTVSNDLKLEDMPENARKLLENLTNFDRTPQQISEEIRTLVPLFSTNPSLYPALVNEIFLRLSDVGPIWKSEVLDAIIFHLESACNFATSEAGNQSSDEISLQKDLDSSMALEREIQASEDDLRKELQEIISRHDAVQKDIDRLRTSLSDLQKERCKSENLCKLLHSQCASLRAQRDTAALEARILSRRISKNHSAKGLSLESVCLILSELGLHLYHKTFQSAEVTGALLEQLNDNDLISLGMTNLLHRKRLCHALWSIKMFGTLRAPTQLPDAVDNEGVSSTIWSSEFIIQRLNLAELSVYEPLFADIPGWAVLHLSDVDLRALGVSKLSEIKQLLQKIVLLREQVEQYWLSHSSTQTCDCDNKKSTTTSVPVCPPSAFTCPITMELMTDPVVAADGHLYERGAIETWLKTHNTSPLTNMPINNELTSCFTVRAQIREWAETNHYS